MGWTRRTLVLAGLAGLAVPAVALAAFPGADPTESPRANTPNDPDFDRCEADDPDTGADCTTYWEEDYRLFGFSPDSANVIPDPTGLLHPIVAPKYSDCSQLDARGRLANVQAEQPSPFANQAQCNQISGIRADLAWKYSTGDPDVVVAILDTGIRWQDTELAEKVHLNAAELPVPKDAGGVDCAADDCAGDGVFNITDYADDPRVAEDAGDTESDPILDASDLIATFSDSTDADSNGFVDDIAGWDFFDDDNDPFDASSCCSANGHGTGRAKEAVAETDNGEASPGICPDCQLMPLRTWDTFVQPGDFYAMGVVYAASNGASVVEGAVGGITNTAFARRAFEYADSKGVAMTLVSSDVNSANHNYPTNYNEAIYVAGALPDSAPLDTCSGPGGLPGFDLPVDIGTIPGFEEGCQQFLGLLDDFLGITPTLQPLTTSFFRNANVTQYGGKADVVLMGTTGSENTGQASGAAGLLASFGREQFGDSNPLTGNEIRQLLTMTAEDVLPANTGAVGLPDRANLGWDSHFGYGRVNLAAAMKRISDERVPPEAQIDSPDWFTPINVDNVGASGVEVTGRAASPHGAGVGAWELEFACGQDAEDSAFQPVPGASGTGPVAPGGTLGTLSKPLLLALAENCNGEVANDAGRPAGALGDGAWPADPYPNPDPERHAFQIRLTVHEAGDPQNFGRYRKTLHAYHDDGNLAGWPRPVGVESAPAAMRTGTGGEVSPRLFDLDGDNALDVIEATSSGEVHVLEADGSAHESWNGGEPQTTAPFAVADAHPLPAGAGAPPRESLRTPSIGDIDGDLEPDVVAAAGEHVYAWDRHGDPLAGYPVRTDPALSEPCIEGVPKPCFNAAERAITAENHIKRGFFGATALADLDQDGRLDVVAGSMDQHLYAWDGDGDLLPGFPAKLASDGAVGAEIINSPAIADLDGDDEPEVIIATNEIVPGTPEFPDEFPTSLFAIINAILSSGTGSNPVYAVHGDGSPVDGWPVGMGAAAGNLLPLVLPGHDAAALDQDGDGDDEVSLTTGTGLGGGIFDGDGSPVVGYQNAAANTLDQGPVINIADYASIGRLSGSDPPAVVKGGATLNMATNLLAANQNLPFSHVVQAWSSDDGLAVTGFPRATDDFNIASQPVIARVAGAGADRQALYGTGLYQLHAYGPTGAEAPGWPKFTGGWTYATPSVGDADGDGNLEVTTLTREGWSFLWDTGVPACSGSNQEWWTFHHDEQSTANYGSDGRPPGTVEDLEAVRNADGSVSLSWTAPGDDWLCGTAQSYRLILDDAPIDDPGDGSVLPDAPAASAGGAESADLTAAEVDGITHAAVLYRDEAGNWGLLRGVEVPPPDDGGGGGGDGDDQGDHRGDCEHRIRGTGADDLLRGTGRSDRINGRRGDDRIKGRGGDDCLKGGRGHDRLRGGSGDDVIRAARGARDRVSCGSGHDVAYAKKSRDKVKRNCETIKRR